MILSNCASLAFFSGSYLTGRTFGNFHEDLHPYKADEKPFDNTETVLRMTIAGQTFLISGDVETRVNDMLCGDVTGIYK